MLDNGGKEYDSWRNWLVISFINRYVQDIFKRYKNKVQYWMTFNEINSSLVMPIMGLGFSIQREEDKYQPTFQAYHHQFVLSIGIKRSSQQMEKIFNNDIWCGRCQRSKRTEVPH